MTSQERRSKFHKLLKDFDAAGYTATHSNIFDGNAGGFVEIFVEDKSKYDSLLNLYDELHELFNEHGEAGDEDYTLVLVTNSRVLRTGNYLYMRGVDY